MPVRRKFIILLLIAIICWVVADLYYPLKTDIRKMDPEKVAHLDAAMWRSYYEGNKGQLFLQSAQLMRNQFHFPLLRSYLVATNVAQAAFTFKEGSSREAYNEALPALKQYFNAVNNISTVSFNTDSAARTELEWWIIRRDKSHTSLEWEDCLCATAAVMYHKPEAQFRKYAALRVQAMLLRDDKNSHISEDDWKTIDTILVEAWKSFAEACQ